MGMLRTLRSVLRFRRPELNANRRRLVGVADVEDLRRISRRRLPAGVFDYIDGGAEDELTMERNADGFRRIEFRPRVLRNVGTVDTSTSVLGQRVPLPLVLAPTGFTRMCTPEGELAVARAAAAVGIPYTLSTLSTRSIEEVAAVSTGRKWFQVYVWRDRELVESMLRRAASSGYEAIVITVDTAMLGSRERDIRRGFTLPPKLGAATILDGMVHPGWVWQFIRSDPIAFANVVGGSVGDGSNAVTLSDYINTQFDPSLSWEDVSWFRSVWPGPVLLKGIQSVADARVAVDAGVEGIVLSNHGGRQLDGAPAPIELLPSVVDAVGGQVEIICDGGVRRGNDIVKAVALGATACMVGRPYLYALAAAGELGVDWVLAHLQTGTARSMALLGTADVSQLTPDLVRLRAD